MKDSQIHVGLICQAPDEHGLWRPVKIASVVRRSKPRRYVAEFSDGSSFEATAEQLRPTDEPAPAIPPEHILIVNHHDRVAAAQQSIKLDLDNFAPESRAHVRLALNAIDAALIHLGMAAHVRDPATPAFPAPEVPVVRSLSPSLTLKLSDLSGANAPAPKRAPSKKRRRAS